jgi:hypothetical protein
MLMFALAVVASAASRDDQFKKSFRLVEEFKTPGLESELSGIYPHPANPDLYYVLTNLKPPYRPGHRPMLEEKYRGKLLTVRRDGTIVKAVRIAEDDFGGLTFVDGAAYVALTNAGTIVKVDPETGKILKTYVLPSPAGGLDYDVTRRALVAQLYVGYPQIALVDIDSGRLVSSLWSDESAMGLAMVDGDWLCTWASGWDPGSVSELRLIDPASGKVRARARLDAVHSVLSKATTRDGAPAFMTLVTTDSRSGATVIRKYGYTAERHWH